MRSLAPFPSRYVEYALERTPNVRAGIEEAFAFFAEPRNLDRAARMRELLG